MTQIIDFAAAFRQLAEADLPEQTISAGDVNVRLVRVPSGAPGRWDSHNTTAETALVWSGDFTVEFRDRALSLSAGQCCVVPIDTEHRGTSRGGAEVVLFTQQN